MKTVYVDELFLINGVITYILLYVTKRIIRARASQPRLILGSIISALYAVFMFLPHHALFYTLAAKLLFSLSLVAITYNIKKIRNYLRAVAVFYMVSFAFGGAAFGLGSLAGWTDTSYMPLKILATSSAAAYFCITMLSSYYKRLAVKEKCFTTADVALNGNSVSVRCFLDTGNTLYDPLSDSPVMVATYQSVAGLLPPEIRTCLSEGVVDRLPSDIYRRIRLIPYSSVGQKEGLLIGFKPDRVAFGDRVCHDIVIGLCDNKLSADESYQALANPYIIGGAV